MNTVRQEIFGDKTFVDISDSLMITKFSLIFHPHVIIHAVLFISGKIHSVMPVNSLHLALQDLPKRCFLHIFVLMVARNKIICCKCTGMCSCYALRVNMCAGTTGNYA